MILRPFLCLFLSKLSHETPKSPSMVTVISPIPFRNTFFTIDVTQTFLYSVSLPFNFSFCKVGVLCFPGFRSLIPSFFRDLESINSTLLTICPPFFYFYVLSLLIPRIWLESYLPSPHCTCVDNMPLTYILNLFSTFVFFLRSPN